MCLIYFKKDSLLNEIHIMRKLNHKSLIKLYEMYESENSIYLVLELIKGGELIKRIAKEKIFNEGDLKILMRNLLEGI